VRPQKEHASLAEIEQPRFFEDLMAAIGATPVPFPPRLRCCGGSLIVTNRRAALSMVRDLLQSAADAQAAVIATVCPLCQLNLECYQRHVNRMFKTRFAVPVLYFTQLMGLALGVPAQRLGIGTELVPAALAVS
jgi:heterodisulfide reductase subunit B